MDVMKMDFTDDEVTTIRAVARMTWDKLSKEYSIELSEDTYRQPETQDIIEACAGGDDIEDTLRSQGHVKLAEKFAELEAEDVITILTEEFKLH